jgi:L-aspartate oxidase
MQSAARRTPGHPGEAAAALDPSWVARLRRTMSEYVGIVRTRAGLDEAADALDALEAEFEARAGSGRNSGAGLELRNMLTVAKLITRSARERHESRGLHFNADFPGPLPEPRDTALCPAS